jgi:hypothetical protein
MNCIKVKRGTITVADCPNLISQWHPTKNNDLKPTQISIGSEKMIWWKCPVADDHEWQVSPHGRGRGCPYCAGQRVALSNCLATTHPDLVKQWHPIKNGKLTPNDVTKGSKAKIWWKCPIADDHEWEASINSMTRTEYKGSGCPCCHGLKVVKSNCLSTTHPDIAKQWHPTKNGNLTPDNFVRASSTKVWWKCPIVDDHEWEMTVANRTLQSQNCPFCANKRVAKSNCLAFVYPELAKQWHPTKNGDLTPYNVVFGTAKKIWWKCPIADDHEWKTSPNSRISMNTGCPYCSNKKVAKSNCLSTTHPDIAKQWHPTKNGNVTPYDVVAGCND